MRLGYGIGKGFVVGEEEVLQQFDRIASEVHKSIVHKLRKKVDSSRLDVIRSLGKILSEFPILNVKANVATQMFVELIGFTLCTRFDAEGVS